MNESSNNFVRQLIGTAFFLALCVASAVTYLNVFAPKSPLQAVHAAQTFDKAEMQRAMSAEHVRQRVDDVVGLGSRFVGQDGFYKTEQYVRRAMESAGLQVLEQKNQTVVPHTIERRITDGSGADLPGVGIWPFFPNHFQPMVSPPDGIRGKLLRVDDDVFVHRTRFDDCIALIDLSKPPENFGVKWTKYAQIGFKAVIVAHPEGLAKIDWNALIDMATPAPVNYVRVAANEKIFFAQAGRDVVLRVRTEYRNADNTTFVGLLKAPGDVGEAVVIDATYDAPSLLPDLAPGVLPAVNLAAELQVLDGLRAYQSSLKRDVLFVFTGSSALAQDAMVQLMAALGPNIEPETSRVRLESETAEHRTKLSWADAALKCFEDDRFFAAADQTSRALAALSPDERKFVDEQVRYVLDTIVLDRSEVQTDARARFLSSPDQSVHGEPFKAFIAAKTKYDEAMTAAGLPVARLASDRPEFLAECDVRARALTRLHVLHDFHTRRLQETANALAINHEFKRYHDVIVLGSSLATTDRAKDAGETISFTMGAGAETLGYVQSPLINNFLLSILQAADQDGAPGYLPLQTARHSTVMAVQIAGLPVGVGNWNAMSYPGFALINTGRIESYQAFGHPVELTYMRDVSTIKKSLEMLGQTALSLSLGSGNFMPGQKVRPLQLGGRVYVANVGQSIVPNFPLAGAVWGPTFRDPIFGLGGYTNMMMRMTDPYGGYELPDCVGGVSTAEGYSPSAVGYGADGLIHFIKDDGPLGQSVYKSTGLNSQASSLKDINIVTFRAAPVTIFDLVNPQTLTGYTAVEFIDRDGLAELARISTSAPVSGDLLTTFLEPDRFFYAKLKAGAPDNEQAQDTRAFLLGTGERDYQPDAHKEIDGPGYLSFDTPLMLDMPLKVARSMIWVNEGRLQLQNRFAMADERTNDFHDKAKRLLGEAEDLSLPAHERTLRARDAVTYATLNHPVLRESIYEAVVGILWYLGLLVPFVFFFEKLAFGYTDVRKQLAAQSVIFIVVFVLLRFLHPAFEMIRSSLMILLGFVILLISGGMTLLSSGKFRENLEGLKRRRGIVTAAEVNTSGVVGTAFMLGLNNMHRRRIRTGLTCGTLVLITFAMISFTSVHSDLMDNVTALGKAPYQGLLVRYDRFNPVTPGELFALQTRYGQQHAVAPRSMYVGVLTWERQQFNPQFDLVFDPAGGKAVKAPFKSLLTFTKDEPLRDKIKMLTKPRWFDKQAYAPSDPLPAIIPDVMAQKLGITVDAVNAGGVVAKVNGAPCEVIGIFDSAAFGQLRDLDGRSLLPFDIEGIANVRAINFAPMAGDDDPQITAEQVVLAPRDVGPVVTNGTLRMISVAVSLDGLAYKPAKSLIDAFLEQSGRSAAYGLDGVAYLGRRARESSSSGLIELLIPLAIAALTVLNTMRGSVYERRDEIFVYNAVGIAPKFIFLMFFAEAFVYAVVGSVLGYILSQGTGRVLTAFGWTGGLNMTFTSLNTIFASMAITAAVFISTLFPALSAMRIAAPAEDSGWRVPPAEGESTTFALPFTFDAADRVGVLVFFQRYFLDHGEGSAGRFRSAEPELGLESAPDPSDGGYVPCLTTTVWLKPFDLGVSQRVVIWLPTDPETGEYIAMVRLTRLAGTRESWTRLQRGFLKHVRKQFLHWRAVSPGERQGMFDEARVLLTQAVHEEGVAHV